MPYLQRIPPSQAATDNENSTENDSSSASPASQSADVPATLMTSSALRDEPNVVSDSDSSLEINPASLSADHPREGVVPEEPSSQRHHEQMPSDEDLIMMVTAIFDNVMSAAELEHRVFRRGGSVTTVDDDDNIHPNPFENDGDDDSESSGDYGFVSSEYESSEDEDSDDDDEDDEDSSEDDSVHTSQFDWERNITKPYFSSRPFQNALIDAKFPVLRNDEGAIVALGDEWDSFLYCGRRLGRNAIPQSDGRCGPNNGPQCASCRRLQTNEKYKILEIIFPSLDRNLLTAALRKRGGNAFAACQFLETSCKNLPRVPPEVAFPGSRPGGIPEPCYPVSDSDARNVVAFFDENISMATAKMALRKNEHNMEQAVTYILDKTNEQLAVETAQDVEQVTQYEDAVLAFQLKRRETIQEVATKLGSADVKIPQDLKKELLALVPEMDLSRVIPSAMEDGHGMVRPSDSSIKCTVCALTIGTKYTGSHYCPQCNYCEGCIQTKVVYKCPRMGNGGHLHPCPLQPMKIGPDRKGYICDIDGKGCLHSENHNLSYYCQECNFDVCAVCISQPAPVYYHRRLGRLMQLSDDEDEDEYSDSDEEEEDEVDDDAVSEASEENSIGPDTSPGPEPVHDDERSPSAEASELQGSHEALVADDPPQPPVLAELQEVDQANEENSVEPDTSPRPDLIDGNKVSSPESNEPRDSSDVPVADDPPAPTVHAQDQQEAVREATAAESEGASESVEQAELPRESDQATDGKEPSESVAVALPRDPDHVDSSQTQSIEEATPSTASQKESEEAIESVEQEVSPGDSDQAAGAGRQIESAEAAQPRDSEHVDCSQALSIEEATPTPVTQTESEGATEGGNHAPGESAGENNTDASNEDSEVSVPTFDLHERIAASRWGANSQEEDSKIEIIIGSGDVRAMERRLKRKQSSDSEELPVMRHNRPETLLTSKYATALETYVRKECPAASNIHHVESLLHLAQGNEKCCPSEAVCQAVSAGKMGIAATCLLAPMYGSKRKKAGEVRCFCGDIVDSKTAPDGAVGCLNGHALHPSCAADYLLSGGNCPTCREPLYFPKVSKAEATAAEEYLELELQRRRKEEEEAILKEQLANGQVFNVNDIVRISSDVVLCKRELMANPGKTGWAPEMDSFCGAIGRITEADEGRVKILNKELQHSFFKPETIVLCNKCSGQVGSKDGEPVADELNMGLCHFCGNCNSCCSEEGSICSKSSIKLNWTPSAVSLIGRASSAALWDKSLVDKDLATAAAAEQHIIRLRAEMNAVTTARATVQEALGNRKGAPSIKALDGLKELVSAFDFERARHLLGLMNHWGNGALMLKEKKAVTETLRKGDIDTAARMIRHHNAALVEDDAKWRYAASDRHEYVVESWAKIDLLAWPSLSAPRTGYCLGPKVRFQSKQEVLGADENIWLLVDENSLILPQFVNGKAVTADPKDQYAYKNLVGCQVMPGPDWNNDNIGADEIGTITAVSGSSVRVKFPRSDSHSWHYPSSGDGPINLLFANPPAPQGWLCMTPRKVPVVRRGRDALQCFSCGDGLVSEDTGAHESIRIVKKDEEIKIGQTLLVAATLEPVEVTSVDDDHVHCSFANQDSVHSISVKFRRDDLLHPCCAVENTEETVTIEGRERGRQDLFMEHGDIPNAKAAWNAAKSSSGSQGEGELRTTTYASCVKGHLLHARCFQEALIAGKKCPVSGCNEPLWAPKVRRLQRDDDACCGGNSEHENGEAAGTDHVSGTEAVARARNENEDVDYHMDRELKMCPACFSGPLLNQNCNDMEAHHGQCVHHAFGNDDEDPCYYCADAKAISSSLMQLSGDKKVVDVLPRCPTHNCVIMFSGCMVCGHLFNETSWADLPKWDPCAKALLDVDRKKRKAAASLVAEITREAALLEYERDAVHNLWGKKEDKEMELPPLPPPAMGFSDAASDSDSDSDEESDY